MEVVVDGLRAEFSDLSAVQAVQLAVRLVIAAVLGVLIGRDRERAGKAAGVRTHILVAVGAAAFVAVPQQSGGDHGRHDEDHSGVGRRDRVSRSGVHLEGRYRGTGRGPDHSRGPVADGGDRGGCRHGPGGLGPSHRIDRVVRANDPRSLGGAGRNRLAPRAEETSLR